MIRQPDLSLVLATGSNKSVISTKGVNGSTGCSPVSLDLIGRVGSLERGTSKRLMSCFFEPLSADLICAIQSGLPHYTGLSPHHHVTITGCCITQLSRPIISRTPVRTVSSCFHDHSNEDYFDPMKSSRSDMERKKQPIFIAKSFVAGGIAGCCAKTTTAPVDRLKILFQTQHKSYSDFGFLSGLRAIVKNEGWLALYKGNGAMMVRVFPYAAIQFMSYEQYKRILTPLFDDSPKTANLFAGSFAGITSVLCTYPLDVVRARFAVQVDERRYNSILHCLNDIYTKEGGMRGLYRGITATIYGMIPYAGISFFTFEFLKSMALTRFKSIASRPSLDGSGKPALKVTANLLCGGLAGAVAQSVSYPLDVARRQMQLVGMNTTAEQVINRGSFQTLRDVYHSNGIVRGLYRGLSLNYYRVVPQVAVSFTIYELMKQLLRIY